MMTSSRAPLADASPDDRSRSAASRSGGHDVEVSPKFVPTPERLSQYLEMNIKEVAASLQSVAGRQMLFDKLMEHEQDILTIDPTFDPELLREQLELAGEVLRQKERYLQDMESPEKKGLLSRSWEKMKGFGKRHPFVTALLVTGLAASVAAAGIAAGYNLTGNWALLMSKLGLDAEQASAAVGGAMNAAEPITESLKGLGTAAVPSEVPLNP